MLRYVLIMVASVIFWSFSWLLFKQIGEQVGFALNGTASQLPGIYVYFPINYPLKIGELVDCDLDFSRYSLQWIKQRHYLDGNKKLLKNIGAVSGDWLFSIHSSIYRCGQPYFEKNCTFLGACMKKDKNGFKLTCQKWHRKKIPTDYFYLQSNRVINSFDSRYFGLVPIRNIHHRLKIIINFS